MDKLTLELAAKAAGYKFRVSGEWHRAGQEQIEITLPSGWKEYRKWTPLADWNDTAMLAKAIEAEVDFRLMCVTARDYVEWATDHNNSIQAALVALAAKIGEAME